MYEKIDENWIIKKSKEMQLKLEVLDPYKPPIFRINSGWFGQMDGAIMDLTYRALVIRREKSISVPHSNEQT